VEDATAGGAACLHVAWSDIISLSALLRPPPGGKIRVTQVPAGRRTLHAQHWPGERAPAHALIE
jgi:hypothetical protein